MPITFSGLSGISLQPMPEGRQFFSKVLAYLKNNREDVLCVVFGNQEIFATSIQLLPERTHERENRYPVPVTIELRVENEDGVGNFYKLMVDCALVYEPNGSEGYELRERLLQLLQLQQTRVFDKIRPLLNG